MKEFFAAKSMLHEALSLDVVKDNTEVKSALENVLVALESGTKKYRNFEDCETCEQIYLEVRKAHLAKDLYHELRRRWPHSFFDADTLGTILSTFERNLDASYDYNDAYSELLDYAIDTTLEYRCRDCPLFQYGEGDCPMCKLEDECVWDLTSCPNGRKPEMLPDDWEFGDYLQKDGEYFEEDLEEEYEEETK